MRDAGLELDAGDILAFVHRTSDGQIRFLKSKYKDAVGLTDGPKVCEDVPAGWGRAGLGGAKADPGKWGIRATTETAYPG